MSESGRRELEVATLRLDDGSIEVCVADRGLGLPDEIAEHLLEPFLTTKRSGMGLGLSICNSIVQAHGGKLCYQPYEGGGAVFRITLPATPDQ
jgi:signal transduction histidine kinase